MPTSVRTPLLAVVLGAALFLPTPARAAWHQPVGGANPLNSPSSSGNAPSLTEIGGVPYVAWMDDQAEQQIRAARLNSAGTAWDPLGSGPNPINLGPTGKQANLPSLTGVSGVPWVARPESDGVNYELRVSRLNSAGTGWDQVGTGPSPINQSPTQSADGPSLLSIGGVPYVAWSEPDGPSSSQVRVSRFGGTAWSQVVGGVSPINHGASEFAVEPSLASVGGVPYVAWSESVGGSFTNFQVHVSRLNAAGTAWQEVVGGASPINHSATGAAGSPKLLAIGGVLYVVWIEKDGSANWQLRASRLNASGTAWEEIGGGALPINNSSSRDAFNPSLAAVGGVPYVAWQEGESTDGVVRVARLDPAGTGWEQVVGGPSPINDSPGMPSVRPSLASVGGVPYVAWAELSSPTVVRVRVARLEPELTQPTALATDSGAVLLVRVRSYGVPSPVAFDYGPGASLGTRTALTTASGDSGTDTVFTAVGGLSPATPYSFRAIGVDGTYAFAPSPTASFTTTPQNGPGPQGPPGAGAEGPPGVGSQGPPGPAGPKGAPAFRLLVAVVNPKLRATAGKRVSVDFLSTATASVALEVLKGRTRVARIAGRATVGRNRLTWNGKAGKKAAAPGSYALRVLATGGDGQAASDAGKLTLARPKPKK